MQEPGSVITAVNDIAENAYEYARWVGAVGEVVVAMADQCRMAESGHWTELELRVIPPGPEANWRVDSKTMLDADSILDRAREASQTRVS